MCSNSWPTKKNLRASTRTHDPFFDNPKIWPTFIYRGEVPADTFAKLPVCALINDPKKLFQKKVYVTIPQWFQTFLNMSDLRSGRNRAKCGLLLNDPIDWFKLRLNQPKTHTTFKASRTFVSWSSDADAHCRIHNDNRNYSRVNKRLNAGAYLFSFMRPASITNTMSPIVIDVSAMFVDRTILVTPSGGRLQKKEFVLYISLEHVLAFQVEVQLIKNLPENSLLFFTWQRRVQRDNFKSKNIILTKWKYNAKGVLSMYCIFLWIVMLLTCVCFYFQQLGYAAEIRREK